VNPLALVVVIAVVAVVAAVAFRAGAARGPRDAPQAPRPSAPQGPARAGESPLSSQLADFSAERHRLFGELAEARAETARYRQIIVDLERDAPPPLLGAPTAPDDLKLIVGVGPVLERMLQQLGIFTYRQIAHWSERDVDAFEARLPEFPGRIRRDAWVTQARALHQSKYGERP
jgi:predicted flap endonuclease-1-like 5' DNA nuclease